METETLVRIRLQDCKEAFAVPGQDNIVDVIRPDTGRSWHYNNTLEEMRERYPGAVAVNMREFFGAIDAKREKEMAEAIWIAITREKYWEMLEVLPPAAMRNGAFMVGEAMDHHKGSPRFSCFKQVGEEYFELSQPITMKRFVQLFGLTSYTYRE